MGRRVLVIGLDSAPPELLFERFSEDLPNIRGMMEKGLYGALRSCDPPITIPAWMVMVTGKSPGSLGMYGFRHRKGGSYKDVWIASSYTVKDEKVWDLLGERGRRVCVVGVPPSYPPQPVNGNLISCFLTPSSQKNYTYPEELKGEIEGVVGEYIFDVDFRVEEKEELLKQIWEMTERRFKAIKYLLKEKKWDFFIFVEIGLDRVHHAFWRFFDKEHHLYQPGNKFENVIPEYYRLLDKEIGEILNLLGEDVITLIVSDHGSKRMKGAFCINQWLIQEGYMKVRGEIKEGARLEDLDIDWRKTTAWGWGGYYARVFLNLQGREKEGLIPPRDYEAVRDELAEAFKKIKGPNGERWDTKVYKPETLYRESRGDKPDLMVYFDDLSWRSAGTLGYPSPYLLENDIGPDDAVHSMDGVFLLYDPQRDYGGRMVKMNILDIAPTILHLMDTPIPGDMEGEVLGEIL